MQLQLTLHVKFKWGVISLTKYILKHKNKGVSRKVILKFFICIYLNDIHIRTCKNQPERKQLLKRIRSKNI